MLQYAKEIMNFPITNDHKAYGLLKKFRAETLAARTNKSI